MRKIYIILIFIVAFGSCSKDQGPRVPPPVKLIFPEENSECISGVSVTDQTSAVTFTWNPSNPASYYILNIYKLNGDLVSSSDEIDPQGTVVLEKGFGYGWEVIAANALGAESDPSERWLFYNAGAQRSYPPFPADLKSPQSGATIVRNDNGTITLLWSGADADNDLNAYTIFLGLSEETMSGIVTLPPNQTSYPIEVVPGNRYFWQVIAADEAGNTSSSGVYDFRVL
jgi:hypothetical protein